MMSAAGHPGWERLSATFGVSRHLRGLPEYSSYLAALSSTVDVDTQAMRADRGLALRDR